MFPVILLLYLKHLKLLVFTTWVLKSVGSCSEQNRKLPVVPKYFEVFSIIYYFSDNIVYTIISILLFTRAIFKCYFNYRSCYYRNYYRNCKISFYWYTCTIKIKKIRFSYFCTTYDFIYYTIFQICFITDDTPFSRKKSRITNFIQ